MENNERKAAVFDFGEVLFETSAEDMYRDLFTAAGKTPTELDYFLSEVFTAQARSKANSGTMAAVTATVAAAHPEWAEYIHAFDVERDFIKQIRSVIPGMEETLGDIVDAGYEIYGLTNWAADTFPAVRAAYPKITDRFNKIVVSGEVGIKKPDPEIFRFAQHAFGDVPPGNVYYFDDKAANTAAAHDAAGWNGIVFENVQTVRKALSL